MVTRAGLLDALRADPGGGPALQEGMELGVLLGVLGAESAAPRLRFLVLRAEAKGKCLFHTCADADPAGRSAEELFTAVTEGLAADWDKPCAVAGYEGLTVGKALEADHGVPLADAAAYLAYRHARPYCTPSLPALKAKPSSQTLTAYIACRRRVGADGAVPSSGPVELQRVADMVGRPVCVWSRLPEGDGVVLESVSYGTGAAWHALNGMHGRGGSHFNCLLGEEVVDGDGEGGGEGGEAVPSTESLRVSKEKWAEQVSALPPGKFYAYLRRHWHVHIDAARIKP